MAANLDLFSPETKVSPATNVPKRIQRQRVRGWRKPAGTICVTRGTMWGNPFIVRPDLPDGEVVGHYWRVVGERVGKFDFIAVPCAEIAVDSYREFMEASPDLVEKAKKNLRGKNLACWCAPGDPCHADVLLEIANR